MLEINTRNKLGCPRVVILDDQVAGFKGSICCYALTFVLFDSVAVCLDSSVGRETGQSWHGKREPLQLPVQVGMASKELRRQRVEASDEKVFGNIPSTRT